MKRLIAIALLTLSASAVWAGGSITVDTSYSYYKDRSVDSIVAELKVNDCDDVHLVCTDETTINDQLLKALRDSGMQIWMLICLNRACPTSGLPKDSESWRMKLRRPSTEDGAVDLCPNNLAYRQWRKSQIIKALSAHQFTGIDLTGALFPAEEGPKSTQYGCMCDSCKLGFKKTYGSDPPDFEDQKSPHYWKTDTTLYEKWVGFRVSSVIEFLDDLVNGKGGIREKCPDVKVATWSLGLDVPDQLRKIREWDGLDGAAIVKRVKPDLHVLETGQLDWNNPDLPAKYPLGCKAIVDALRDASPGTPISLQVDIGSRMGIRRSRAWLDDVGRAAKQVGCKSVIQHEYHLGEYMYTESPTVIKAQWDQGAIKLVFNKRLDTVSASSLANYTLSSGKIDYARVDGNIVRLSVSGADDNTTVNVSGISDDESTRLFHDRPACTMERGTLVSVEEALNKETRQ